MDKTFIRSLFSPGLLALIAVLGLEWTGACKSVDPEEPVRLAAERAERLKTIEAYQAFLDMRPRSTLYAKEMERARAAIDAATSAQLMGLDLAGQANYLRSSKNRLAREEVLTAVVARVGELDRVEQIQWMYDLAWPCTDGGAENSDAMRRMLAPPDPFIRGLDVPDLGPGKMDPIERCYFAYALGRARPKSPEARRTGIGYLLAISTDRSDMRLTASNQRYVPADQGIPTSPRKVAIEALAKFAEPFDVVHVALQAGTLAGDRAWSIVQEWLSAESTYDRKASLFVGLMHTEVRDIGERFLPLAEQMSGDLRVRALLECVRRRVPRVSERIGPWLAGDDVAEQVAAAYALGLGEFSVPGYEKRLGELEGSDERLVRSAVAMAKRRANAVTPSPDGAPLDARGEATIGPFLKRLHRGFLTSTDTSYVDLSAPPPDLDYSSESPLRTAGQMSGSQGQRQRSTALAELGRIYHRLRHASDPRGTVLRIKKRSDDAVEGPVIGAVMVLAVIERERELSIDPDVEGRWFFWPHVYYCYLDPETDVVLGTHSGPWGERLLPVPDDVERTVRQIFDITGIHSEYPGVEGGLVVVNTPGYLRTQGSTARSLIKKGSDQLASSVHPIGGRVLSSTDTRWLHVWRAPANPQVDYIYGPLHPLQEMGPRKDDSNFRSELVFAQTAGRVTEIKDSAFSFGRADSMQITIDGESGETTLSGLALLGVEVGETIARGQWIGMRWREK